MNTLTPVSWWKHAENLLAQSWSPVFLPCLVKIFFSWWTPSPQSCIENVFELTQLEVSFSFRLTAFLFCTASLLTQTTSSFGIGCREKPKPCSYALLHFSIMQSSWLLCSTVQIICNYGTIMLQWQRIIPLTRKNIPYTIYSFIFWCLILFRDVGWGGGGGWS